MHTRESVISLPRIRSVEASIRIQAFRYRGKGHPCSDTDSTVTERTRIILHRTALAVQEDEFANDGSQITSLPQLPMFGNKGQDDGDSYDRWLRKLDRHVSLQKWSLREKMLQFELRLTGKAEQIYEVLLADVKKSPDAAIEVLRERLHPVSRDALASAQLMRCKQQWRESVDNYAQAFVHLFDKSYGVRHGMDTASKATLKRDLFVQGLHLKWQERVLPSAESFEDALFQARIAEEQERDLAYLHKQHPIYQYSDFRRDVEPSSTYASKKQSTGAKPLQNTEFLGTCFSCGKVGHRQRDCPLTIPPSEATGHIKATNSVITITESLSQPKPQNSAADQCAKLHLALADPEFQQMSQTYTSHTGDITAVTGALGPLFYATVSIEGIPVRGLVDSGSSATIISYNVFQKFGQTAKIPASELQQPDVILRDYSQRTIPVGASVKLTVSFQGQSITVPVYIQPVDISQCESCLLGTNVVIPLKLVTPHSSLITHTFPLNTDLWTPVQAPVHMLKAVRIPARTGIVVEGNVRSYALSDTLLMFNPDEQLLQANSINISTALVQQPTNGRVWLFVENSSSQCQELSGNTNIGHIEAC